MSVRLTSENASHRPRGEVEFDLSISGKGTRTDGAAQSTAGMTRLNLRARRFVEGIALSDCRDNHSDLLRTSVRRCGERHYSSDSFTSSTGSAPRVRGTPSKAVCSRNRWRFSPAGAGNARCSYSTSKRMAVQPRGCGERVAQLSLRMIQHGSAPRVRGTRSEAGRRSERRRFSPAGAGNAHVAALSIRQRSVQPRGCGERKLSPVMWTFSNGSAPRVRGTLLDCFRP